MQGEMKGGDLIGNLHWLGQSGGLMTLMDESEDELNSDNDDSEQNDDNNELIGRGLVVNSKKRKRSKDNSQRKFEEERNIQRAMPEMENTLGNWTLHGQNLGKMLKNYKRQYRHLPPDHM